MRKKRIIITLSALVILIIGVLSWLEYKSSSERSAIQNYLNTSEGFINVIVTTTFNSDEEELRKTEDLNALTALYQSKVTKHIQTIEEIKSMDVPKKEDILSHYQDLLEYHQLVFDSDMNQLQNYKNGDINISESSIEKLNASITLQESLLTKITVLRKKYLN